MLQTFYHTFGFLGAIGVVIFGFTFIIFWFAGIAGIMDNDEATSWWKLTLAIFVPPFSITWLITDMVQSYRYMNRDQV